MVWMPCRPVFFAAAAAAATAGLAVLLAAAPPATPPGPGSPLTAALAQAERGDCAPALPVLRRELERAPREEQYKTARLLAQCGMTQHDAAATDQGLNFLNRHYPDNPRVLYIASHFYSEMANRYAHRLLRVAPKSPAAQEMLAEAMEARGQWKQAAAIYESILKSHPLEPGVHYQLGRILLTQSYTPKIGAAAKKDFEAELQLDPHSAAAEFMLGELALHGRSWPQAIRHFRNAVSDDGSFTEADLGLGMALNSARRYSAAIGPLRRYVAATPADPAGHYQLALALGRSGHAQAAAAQMAMVRKLAAAGRRPGATAAENQAQPH